jgi:hypothetical protein
MPPPPAARLAGGEGGAPAPDEDLPLDALPEPGAAPVGQAAQHQHQPRHQQEAGQGGGGGGGVAGGEGRGAAAHPRPFLHPAAMQLCRSGRVAAGAQTLALQLALHIGHGEHTGDRPESGLLGGPEESTAKPPNRSSPSGRPAELLADDRRRDVGPVVVADRLAAHVQVPLASGSPPSLPPASRCSPPPAGRSCPPPCTAPAPPARAPSRRPPARRWVRLPPTTHPRQLVPPAVMLRAVVAQRQVGLSPPAVHIVHLELTGSVAEEGSRGDALKSGVAELAADHAAVLLIPRVVANRLPSDIDLGRELRGRCQ